MQRVDKFCWEPFFSLSLRWGAKSKPYEDFFSLSLDIFQGKGGPKPKLVADLLPAFLVTNFKEHSGTCSSMLHQNGTKKKS